MHKIVTLFLLVVVGYMPLCAQSSARAARIIVRAEEMVQESLPRVQGKIWTAAPLEGRPTVHNFSTMERFVQMQLPTRAPRDFKFVDPIPSLALAGETVMRYTQVRKNFERFRKDMDVFLYYQAKPVERRELVPAERRQWLERLGILKRDVEGLSAYLSTEDEGLRQMRDYITYAYTVVEPELANVMFVAPLPPRTDRTFSLEEFCLHNPPKEPFAWMRSLPGIRNRLAAHNLPQGLKVAVLNDRHSVLQKMRQKHEEGIFLPTGTLYTYLNAEDLLNDVINGSITPDVILTDILVSDKGGGYYVAAELRLRNYPGAILALTAYQEHEEVGLEMFRHGLDGLISEKIGFEDSSAWPSHVMQAISNYFYYRKLHGWEH